MYNCGPCGKNFVGAKAKSQHDRLVHSKVWLKYTVYETLREFNASLPQNILQGRINDEYVDKFWGNLHPLPLRRYFYFSATPFGGKDIPLHYVDF